MHTVQSDSNNMSLFIFSQWYASVGLSSRWTIDTQHIVKMLYFSIFCSNYILLIFL